MSVASKNPFELLGDEDGSPSVPAPSSTKVEKEQATAAPASSSNRGGQRGRTGPASRGGRYYQRGGGSKASPRDQAEGDNDAPREEKRSGEEGNRGRGRGGRGRGGDRGRGGGRGRTFDRHSQTGKTDSEKKIHQGWGGDEGNSELKAEVEGSKDAAAAETPTNEWASGPAGNAEDAWGAPTITATEETPATDAPAEGRRPREEEEDNTLTLDQYLAKQKESSVVPKLEGVRKANDGADDLFKDAVRVVKGEEDAYFAGKPKQSKQRSKAKEEKVTIEIDGQFSDRAPRGGRGGRGGDRGRGSRGGGRGGGRGRGRGDFHGTNGNASTAVDVDDQSAFPSLA